MSCGCGIIYIRETEDEIDRPCREADTGDAAKLENHMWTELLRDILTGPGRGVSENLKTKASAAAQATSFAQADEIAEMLSFAKDEAYEHMAPSVKWLPGFGRRFKASRAGATQQYVCGKSKSKI
jgi:hypothetical protein